MPPVDRDEATEPEGACQNRDLIDLVLIKDVHPRVQRVEEHRRVDVALMIRAEHGGAVERNVFGAFDPETDAAEEQADSDAEVAQDVKQALPAERQRQQHADRSGDQHVKRNSDVGGGGAESDDDHRNGIIAARGESRAAFDGRGIPAGGVAPPSNTPGIIGRRALPPGRLAALVRRWRFTTGC